MTTYNVNTAVDVYGHLTGQVGYPSSYEDGDEIIIAAGYYSLPNNVSVPGGRLSGVHVKGAGFTSTVFAPRYWSINGYGDDGPTRTIFSDFRIMLDNTSMSPASYGSMNVIDGHFDFRRVWISSNNQNVGNNITFVAYQSACLGVMRRCRVTGANRDCVSTKAPGGSAKARMSVLELIDCSLSDQGVNGNDQCVTSHDEFAIRMFGGSLRSSSPDRAAAAQDYAYSELSLHRVGVPVGTVRVIVTGTWWEPTGWKSRN